MTVFRLTAKSYASGPCKVCDQDFEWRIDGIWYGLALIRFYAHLLSPAHRKAAREKRRAAH